MSLRHCDAHSKAGIPCGFAARFCVQDINQKEAVFSCGKHLGQYIDEMLGMYVQVKVHRI